MIERLLDLIGCEFIDFGHVIDDAQKLTGLYLEHYHQGKIQGYTPVLMHRDYELPAWYWDHFNVPPSAKHYPILVEKILNLVNSKSYEAWHNEIFEKYTLDIFDDEKSDEDKMRSLIEEIFSPVSEAQYLLQIQSQKAVPLRIQKYVRPDKWESTDNDICYVDKDDVLALIPTCKSYEVLAWLPIGGFNWCPTAEYQTAFAKHMFESYGAEVMSVYGNQIEFYLPEPLTDKEKVFSAAHDLVVMDEDRFNDMEVAPRLVYGKQWLRLWWD